MAIDVTPPQSPPPHSAATPAPSSAPPADHMPRPRRARPDGICISPIGMGPGCVFDDSTQLPTPSEPDALPSSEPGGAGCIFHVGLPSPKFPMSPRTSGGDGTPGFTPHYMDIDEPRAPEFQWPSGPRTAQLGAKRSVWSPIAAAFGHQSSGSSSPAPPAEAAGCASMESLSPQDSENAANRIKRSLSTLLQRSSSVLRRGGPGARSPRQLGGGYGGHTRQCSESIPRTFARSSSPTPSLEDRAATAGDIACALAASHFFVSAANTAVSSLVGNSMVHVKVVMDGDTAVVVPMLRTMVFATARERILTKLFQGGVPLVESKSRTLAVRRRDGSMAPVVDNQTWRMAMEVAARAHSQQAKAAGAPPAMIAQPAALPLTTRTVVKLTLHLTSLALP